MKVVFNSSVRLDKRFSFLVKVCGKCRLIDECVVSNGKDCLLEMKWFTSTRLTRFAFQVGVICSGFVVSKFRVSWILRLFGKYPVVTEYLSFKMSVSVVLQLNDVLAPH